MIHRKSQLVNQNLMGFYGGFISRFVAFLIDTIIISVTAFFTTWFFSITLTILQLKYVLDFFINAIPFSKPFIDSISTIELGGTIFLIWVAIYHIFFWTITGQTPGKGLLGLRVVPLGGGKMSWWRAFVRYFGYFISGILFLGFIWIILDDRRQGWHDKLSGTCVIYTWPAKPDERFLAEQISEIDHQ